MESVSFSEVFQMPVADRIRLAQALWDSVARDPDQIPITDTQKALLDEYYAEYQANPNEGSPWPEVKARLLSRE